MTLIQVFILCIASVSLIWFFSVQVAISFFAGGIASIVPALIFGQLYFRKKQSKAPKLIVKSLYISETIKFLVTAILLTITFKIQAFLMIWVLVGFFITTLTQLLLIYLMVTVQLH